MPGPRSNCFMGQEVKIMQIWAVRVVKAIPRTVAMLDRRNGVSNDNIHLI